MLGLQYFAEMFSVPIVWTTIVFITGSETSYLSDMRAYLNNMNVIVWGVPFISVFLYLTFGSDFFLFRWVDEVSVFMIQYWVSNVGFIAHLLAISAIFSAILEADYTYQSDDYWGDNYCSDYNGLWGGNDCPSTFVSFLYLLIHMGLALYFEFNHISRGVDAIRHIDPFWNEHRRFLFPSLLYTFGIVDEEKGGSGQAPQPVDSDIDLTNV